MTRTIMVNRHSVVEFEPGRLCVDASDLGLHPGEWPDAILTDDLGNHLPFRFYARTCDWVTYAQELGSLTLRVFND